MDELRRLLCENEEKVEAFMRNRPIVTRRGETKYYRSRANNIQLLGKDGDLYKYLKASMSAEDAALYTEKIHEGNFQTCLELIEDYFDGNPPDDYLDIKEIFKEYREGTLNRKFSTIEIAAMSDSFNIPLGMQLVNKDGEEYVIIKCNLFEGRAYQNQWIVPYKSIKYYLQKETEENMRAYTLKCLPNRRIFDSLVYPEDPIDIHLFTRTEKNSPYDYQGIYRALSLDGTAFILGNTLIKPEDRDYVRAVYEPSKSFEINFIEKNVDDIIGAKKVLVEKDPPASRAMKKDSSSFTVDPQPREKRNYIKEAEINEKIGLIGERAVWEYEKEKIRKAYPEGDPMVEKLLSQMAWVSQNDNGVSGYDIRSFNIENGEPVPIFIEVKTTRSNDPTAPFYITKHELETARSYAVNRNYYIYRVYNINSDQPLFYYMKGNPENFYQLEACIWLAKVR